MRSVFTAQRCPKEAPSLGRRTAPSRRRAMAKKKSIVGSASMESTTGEGDRRKNPSLYEDFGGDERKVTHHRVSAPSEAKEETRRPRTGRRMGATGSGGKKRGRLRLFRVRSVERSSESEQLYRRGVTESHDLRARTRRERVRDHERAHIRR